MAQLLVYKDGCEAAPKRIDDAEDVVAELTAVGMDYEQLYLNGSAIDFEAAQDEVIESHRHQVNGLMRAHDFASIDVLMLTAQTPRLDEIRRDCLREHVHLAAEGRFFLAGRAMLGIRAAGAPLMTLICKPGDFVRLPAGLPHWFDTGEQPNLCTVRFFHSSGGYQACEADGGHIARPPGLDELPNCVPR